ncbi:MAG TPA: hypothetical protein VMB53_03670 [Gaiellaceae bacterium]|nr:hypothetical protein [Gaiellaceae bacterium]
MRRAVAAFVCVVAAAAAGAHVARADGDPASDYLITMPIYFPYDTKFSPELEAQLIGIVDDAKTKGFPIKVALIPNRYDLGSVGVLWKRPRQYAKFLGLEDAPFFKQRLLVVMPNGFGFHRPGQDSTAEDAALAKIPIQPGADGLVRAAIDGVTALAAADGIKVTPGHVTTQAQRNSHDRVVIIVAVVAALLLGALARLALRRRTTSRRPER